MRYNQQDKKRYILICQAYNRASGKLRTEAGKAEFLTLSVRLHIAKANVPKRWCLPSFLSRCGVGG